MKRSIYVLGAALAVAAVLAGCNRHPAPAADKGPATARPSVAAVAVTRGATTAAAVEKAVGMTEESESAADVAAGLSPIAAAVAANTPATATPIPAKWVEGKSYTTLVPAQPTNVGPDRVEVIEVFWYGCGHCFHLDPTLESWRHQGKAPFVDFGRVPVMWNEVHRSHARLFYTLEALGKLEQLHVVVFREIHVKNNLLVGQDPAETEKLQRTFLKANGISDADFDRTYHSFTVETKLQRAEQLTRRYKVTGVPVMVINGKYTADVGSAGTEPQLISLIDDLAASEHRR